MKWRKVGNIFLSLHHSTMACFFVMFVFEDAVFHVVELKIIWMD